MAAILSFLHLLKTAHFIGYEAHIYNLTIILVKQKYIFIIILMAQRKRISRYNVQMRTKWLVLGYET